MSTAHVVKQLIKRGCGLVTSGNTVLELLEPYWVELQPADYLYGSGTALYNAVNAIGLPALWSDHPCVPNLSVMQYLPEVNEAFLDKVLVTVRYVNAAPQVVIRGGCGLVIKQTDMDRHGQQIILTHTPVPGASPVKRAGLVRWLCPQATHAIQRVQPSLAFPNGINPAMLHNAYMGKINSNPVNVFGVNMPAGTLLCECISEDNEGLWGVAWRMTYEFRYDPDGFNPEAALEDPGTGLPYRNLLVDARYFQSNPLARVSADSGESNAVGRKIIDRQEPVDFAPLFL